VENKENMFSATSDMLSTLNSNQLKMSIHNSEESTPLNIFSSYHYGGQKNSIQSPIPIDKNPNDFYEVVDDDLFDNQKNRKSEESSLKESKSVALNNLKTSFKDKI
jgi:hypothetical protein